MEVHAVLEADAPGLAHFEVRDYLARGMWNGMHLGNGALSECRRHGQTVALKCQHIAVDRFANIFHRVVLGFSLAYATGQAGALNNPKTIFARIEHDLTHT